jgi:hypothetical protein
MCYPDGDFKLGGAGRPPRRPSPCRAWRSDRVLHVRVAVRVLEAHAPHRRRGEGAGQLGRFSVGGGAGGGVGSSSARGCSRARSGAPALVPRTACRVGPGSIGGRELRAARARDRVMSGDELSGPTTPGPPPPTTACARSWSVVRSCASAIGDGFSHARAFALQLALAAVPLIIAGAPGWPRRSGRTRSRTVVARTYRRDLTGRQRRRWWPTSSPRRRGHRARRSDRRARAGGRLFLAASVGRSAQLERGAQPQYYGTDRDRAPRWRKYGWACRPHQRRPGSRWPWPAPDRGGRAFGDALETVYRWGGRRETCVRTSCAGRWGCCCLSSSL